MRVTHQEKDAGGGYKYTKPNVAIMTPILIRVYKANTSQPNVPNMMTGFDKSST